MNYLINSTTNLPADKAETNMKISCRQHFLTLTSNLPLIWLPSECKHASCRTTLFHFFTLTTDLISVSSRKETPFALNSPIVRAASCFYSCPESKGTCMIARNSFICWITGRLKAHRNKIVLFFSRD